jgi:DNA-binding MarR family transcriptional regulator
VPKRPLAEGIKPDRPVEIANRLNSAAIHLLRRISREDGADSVTGARLSALSVLVHRGPQTVSALARREGVATPTMTRIIDALVRDGIVTRTPVEGDRRQFRLAPSEDGRRLIERGRARRIERLAGEVAALKPKQQKALERALEILEALEVQEPAR